MCAVSGEPAKDWNRFDIDWVPTQKVGHSKQQDDVNVERDERRKRRQERIEKQIAAKLQKISEPEVKLC